MNKQADFAQFCENVGVVLSFDDMFFRCMEGYSAGKSALAESATAFDRLTELQPQKEFAALCWCTQMAYEMRPFYEEHGITEEIFYDTMKDLGIWQKNYFLQSGKIGLTVTDWFRLHMTGAVFRLGRLQFEMTVFKDEGQNIPKGAKVLSVHIPQGEPLDVAACSRSFHRAIPFFEEHFSFASVGFICTSWLLDSALREMLSETSNILKFQDRFYVYNCIADETQSMERIFGLARKPEEPLPEKSSLQKAAKAYLGHGGSFCMGTGYVVV